MNVELLERVKQAILEEPRKVDMEVWATTAEKATKERIEFNEKVAPEKPPCGTVGCIAGWTLLVGLKDPQRAMRRRRREGDYFWQDKAQERLELNWKESQRLFVPDEWPVDLQERLSGKPPGTVAYARIVAERIDRFIQTEGRE